MHHSSKRSIPQNRRKSKTTSIKRVTSHSKQPHSFHTKPLSPNVSTLAQNDQTRLSPHLARFTALTRPPSKSPFTTQRKRYSGLNILPQHYQHPYPEPGQTKMLPQGITSYDQLRDFRIKLPAFYNMGVDISDKHVALGNGTNTAIIYVNQETNKCNKVDYNFISTQSNRLANALTHLGPRGIGEQFGIQKGDRVSILMSQSIEVGVIHSAVYKTGAIALPLSVLFGPEALEYRINASGSKVLFIEPGKLPDLIEIIDKVPSVETIIVAPHLSSISSHDSLLTDVENLHLFNLKGLAAQSSKIVKLLDECLGQASASYTTKMTSVHDPALLIATSGTTGMPKLALHRQSVLLGHLPGIEFFYDFFPKQNDVIFTGSDVSWIGGLLNTLLVSMHHGVPVLASRAKKFDAEYMFKLFQDFQITTAFLPPTALKMMKDVPSPKSKWNYNVRAIGSGGECLGESVLEWGKQAFGVEINEFYGQTECNLVLGNSSRIMKVKPGSMGMSIPGHHVEVINNDGKVLDVGQVGEIAVKSPHPIMFSGYLNNEKATKDKFIGDWMATGDLGRKDEQGYFYYVGRNDDVISSAGYRIGPAEVEMSLHHHPLVSNSAVIGAPDELRQEVVKAFVVLSPAAQMDLFGSESAYRDYLTQHPHGQYPDSHKTAQLAKEMTEFVKNKLAKHEFPRQIEFVAELPMTTTGKVIRKTLKKQEFERYYKSMGKELPPGMF